MSLVKTLILRWQDVFYRRLKIYHIKFEVFFIYEVLEAVTIIITVLQNMTPCGPAGVDQHFMGILIPSARLHGVTCHKPVSFTAHYINMTGCFQNGNCQTHPPASK